MKILKKTTKKINDPLKKDLSHLFSKSSWKKMSFELKAKNKSITLRLNEDLLEAIKSKAQEEGVDYQKWIRASLEEALDMGA